jgi:hypothetical protein
MTNRFCHGGDHVSLFLRVVVDELHRVALLHRVDLGADLLRNHEGIGLAGLRVGNLRATVIRALEQQAAVLLVDPHHLAARLVGQRGRGGQSERRAARGESPMAYATHA